LLKNLIEPFVQPIDVGVKLTLTSALCPASKTIGRLVEDMANSALLTEIAEIVALVCPLFVTGVCKVSV